MSEIKSDKIKYDNAKHKKNQKPEMRKIYFIKLNKLKVFQKNFKLALNKTVYLLIYVTFKLSHQMRIFEFN